MEITGRTREIETLKDCYNSDNSEFIAVYGRRRIGKTFLVKTLFEEEFTFYSTGILGGNRQEQIAAWNRNMSHFGGKAFATANDWMEAFENLNLLIEKSTAKKKIVFLDEIPWMATRNSNFTAGLDYFWNRWASSRRDVLLIICGSAASWISDKIIKNRGGLHNRLTRHIYLQPFNLRECELYLNSRNIPLTRQQIAEAYMIFGGIPYYLSLMKPHYSLHQNVDNMYFAKDAELRIEFTSLYNSLYNNSEKYIRVIEALAEKGIGLSRIEIAKASKISDGGGLTKILDDLSVSGFIREYRLYGHKKRDSLFQLMDPFSLFDVRFRNERKKQDNSFWLSFSATTAHSIWVGLSYEKLCLAHLPQIRKALGISGVLCGAYSWRGESDGRGAQIDLVIDRNDNIINLCEVKFSNEEYQIKKDLYDSLRVKRSVFKHATNTRKSVQSTIITTYGTADNAYSREISSQVVLDDLFEA